MEVMFALYLVVILSIMDNLMTYKLLSLYRKRRPDDNKWYDLEANKIGRIIFKKWGFGKKSLILNLVHSAVALAVFFYFIWLFKFDLEFFVYSAFGGLVFVNLSHYRNYRRMNDE